MEKSITLTMKEQKRVEIIERVIRGELRMGEAALVLGVSEHHSDRIKAEIREEGVKGIVLGNRGRSSGRKLSVEVEIQIVGLARGSTRDLAIVI